MRWFQPFSSGFQYGEYEFDCDDDDPSANEESRRQLAANQDSRRRLVEFLAVALQHQPAVEVFACWSGDEAVPVELRGRVRPADLLRDRTFFRERELLVISEQDAGPLL